MKLQIEDLSFSYTEHKMIEDINLHVNNGELVGIIGPNGSGKSTVLKNLYRAFKPDSGVVLLDGEDMLKMNIKKSAKKVGVVGQENTVPFDFKVEDIVAMGRSPHKRLFEGETQSDKNIVHEALGHVGMQNKSKRNYRNLSGGEKQRVLLARVLAQQTDLLLMDEPTNHLDIYYQLQMFDLLKGLGVTVLSAIHDLNMAALYCNRLYVLKAGRLYKSGTPEEVLTSETIRDVYGVRADVTNHPVTRKVAITYLPANL
ncbi:ABC transporter ATP-binding protein [Paenibacillus nasutitermitis]|uniref:ABC transporter n=1 Tax=Paenibacillus nasutitermitis TaxID=1652958 RepID=A0A917DRV0_9BACL|nr:ABC transporter ATP-binding protein [Paenibacillus nasutitermitis]GGD60719.1 ABC transporter [Paenibacillus nasutitermitis]